MTNGPIGFLSDRTDQSIPPSEYGGASGLIQPAPHQMTAGEKNAAMSRASRNPDGIDPVTGLDADDLAED